MNSIFAQQVFFKQKKLKIMEETESHLDNTNNNAKVLDETLSKYKIINHDHLPPVIQIDAQSTGEETESHLDNTNNNAKVLDETLSKYKIINHDNLPPAIQIDPPSKGDEVLKEDEIGNDGDDEMDVPPENEDKSNNNVNITNNEMIADGSSESGREQSDGRKSPLAVLSQKGRERDREMLSDNPEKDHNTFKTRKMSLPGENKHIFTIVNYGETPLRKLPKTVESNKELDNSDHREFINERKLSGSSASSLPTKGNKKDNKKRKISRNKIILADSDSDVETNLKNFLSQNSVPEIIISTPSKGGGKTSANALALPSRRTTLNTLSPTQQSDDFKLKLDDDDHLMSYSDDEGRISSRKWRAKIHKNVLKPSESCSTISGQSINASKTWNARSRTLSVYNLANMISSPIRDVIKRGRTFAKRKQDRLILKNGSINLQAIRVERKGIRFFNDLFTTIIEVKWKYMILLLASAFLGTWVGFGLIWWAICHFQIKRGGPECVSLVNDFESALLFSVETQHTIGYGTRAVSTECPIAIFFVMLQSLVGVTMACVTTGLVFAKFATPRRKSDTLMFSKNAVIYEKDDERYLSFRVGDIRQNHMIQVSIQAIMFSHDMDQSNSEEAPFEQHNLHVESEAENCFFLAWPIEIRHKVDDSSPLWEMSEDDLLDGDFEIVVVFEGCVTSTGQTTQICTSYLPSEILWAEKLEPMITGRKESGKYLINYKDFDSTSSIRMSSHSAKDRLLQNEKTTRRKDFNANHYATWADTRIQIE